MNPKEFLSTVYLGDRACKKVLMDGWNERFGIQVDTISRLKEGTTTWNFYSDKDVDNGWLVFSGLKSVSFHPEGFIPHDLINGIDVTEDGDLYLFEISIGSGGDDGIPVEVIVKVLALEVSIETNEEFLKAMSA